MFVYTKQRAIHRIGIYVFWRLCGNFSVLEFKAEWIWIPTISLYIVHFITWLRSAASTTWIFLVLVSGFCATAVNAQAFNSLQIACYWLLLILGKNIDWNFSKIGEIYFNRVVLTSLASIVWSVYSLLFSLIQNIAILHSI